MKNYKIITLGTSGAGKTVFLASLFKRLSTQGEMGFFIQVPDSQKAKELNKVYTEIVTREAWPAGTRNVSEWTFTCSVKNLELDNYQVCQFTYIDYAGGLLTDMDEEDEDSSFNFHEEVPNADAILAIIDGLKVYKFMEDQSLSNRDVLIWLNRDLPHIMQLVDKCGKETPVHFIITKWDLLIGKYSLSDVLSRLLEKAPEFKDVVRSREKAGCPIRIIPTSSIGEDFAVLQSDGSMKKNAGAIPTPFQVEVPLACVLIDRVKAYMNTVTRGKETINQSGTNFEFLGNLIQSFLNKELSLLDRSKQERLKEVKNEQAALNYLVSIFLSRLQRFEQDFPDANLGGEVLFSSANAVPIPSKMFDEAVSIVSTLTGHKKMVRSVGFTSDGQTIFSSSHDKTIRFWQVTSGKLQGIVNETSGLVLSGLSKNNQLLFTASEDKSIKIWDAKTGKRLHKPLKGHSDHITAFIVSPDGRTLVSGSRDRTVKIWQIGTEGGQLTYNLTGHHGFVYSLAVSPDWRVVASGSSDNTVFLWELASGRLLHSLDKHKGFIRALAFSPDGKSLASGCFDSSIYIWDWQTSKLQYELRGHKGAILSLAISSDNRLLASGSEDCIINLWDLSNRTLATTLTGHTGRVLSLAFSPDNKALASGSEDNTVKIWQLA